MLKNLIRIAHENPETQADLFPIIKDAMKQAAITDEDEGGEKQAFVIEALQKVANNHSETRKHLIPIIKEAMKFKTPEALKKYLDSHPKADKSLHSVGTPSPADKLRSELKKDMQKKKKDEDPDKLKGEKKPSGKGMAGKEPKRTDKVPSRVLTEDTKALFQQAKSRFKKDKVISGIIKAVLKGKVSFGDAQKALKHIGKKRDVARKKIDKPGFNSDINMKDQTVNNSYLIFTQMIAQLSDMVNATWYDVNEGSLAPAKKKPAPKSESGKGSVSKATVKKFLPKTLNNSLKSVFPNSPLSALAESVDKGNVTTEQLDKALAHAEKKMKSTQQMANSKNAPSWAAATFGNYQKMVGVLKDMKAAGSSQSDKKKDEKKDTNPSKKKPSTKTLENIGEWDLSKPAQKNKAKKLVSEFAKKHNPDITKKGLDYVLAATGLTTGIADDVVKDILKGLQKHPNKYIPEGTSSTPSDTKPAPAKSKYNKKVQTVMTKHNLVDDDADEVKAFKKKKPDTGTSVSPAILLQRFLAKAKPETKKRMKGVSPADFMKMLGAIMDEDEAVSGKQASFREQLTRIASEYPETRKHIIPLLKE